MKLFQGRLFRLIVTLICLIATVMLSRSIYGLWRRRDIVHERASVLLQLQNENKRLNDELRMVQQPEFIEREARNKLGLVREGEKVVLVPQSSTDQLNNTKETVEASMPTWRQWWRLFF